MDRSICADRRQTENHAVPKRTREEVAAIYSRQIETVYRVCFSLMGNRPDAEDAVQGVFLKLMKNNPPFSDKEHEKAWLITTARNHCRDIHRQWWRRKSAVLDETAEAIPDAGGEADALMETLLRLPPKFRIVLYLHFYEGYKLSEIASLLKLNLNTVKTQLRAAKRQLKIQLGDDWNDESATEQGV